MAQWQKVKLGHQPPCDWEKKSVVTTFDDKAIAQVVWWDVTCLKIMGAWLQSLSDRLPKKCRQIPNKIILHQYRAINATRLRGISNPSAFQLICYILI